MATRTTTGLVKSIAASAIIAAAGLTLAAAPGYANKHSAHYNKQTVTKKASFHTLKHHAKKLRKSGLAKVSKIKRHGRTVGFKKTLKSGDKIIVRRGKHGRVHHTTLKRKTFLQRVKHRVSSASKKIRAKAKQLRFSLLGKKQYARH